MKKTLFIILLSAVSAFSAFAEEPEKKQYLPEAGDWSVGFNAIPILDFVGNLFSDNYNLITPIGGQPTLFNNISTSIMGKYMLTDNLALRANIGLAINNDNDAMYVRDDEAYFFNPLSEEKVIDYKKIRNTRVSIMAGAEYRIGKKRVQGVFGGGLLFGLSNSREKYQYGNMMTDINPNPTTANFNENYEEKPMNRVLEQFHGSPCYHFGLVGTVGVEWFFAPKISLGAEVSLHAAYEFNQQTYTVSEEFNSVTDSILQSTDLTKPAYGEFSFGTETLGGNISFSFYF